MRRRSVADMRCGVAQALEVIGEWWTVLILRDLFNGINRFDAIARDLGIATNVLTTRLQRLVDDGIVVQRPYQDRPPRMEYVLTEKGRALYPVLIALKSWGDRWQAGPERRSTYRVIHNECGHEVGAVVRCEHCDRDVRARETKRVLSAADGDDLTSDSTTVAS